MHASRTMNQILVGQLADELNMTESPSRTYYMKGFINRMCRTF